MNYHVFIVDQNTFQYHLAYMFAGTGAGDKAVSFLGNASASFHWAAEANLVGMIADISRIREGDKIIFYLQAANGNPGMFYGVFTAASTAFFDENDGSNYLIGNLRKPLTFRIRIAPDCVYPLGVSEHDYLDRLENTTHPYQMCWSLIYRKLKGNRGCTMITDCEYRTLISKLESINNGSHLGRGTTAFTFNSNTLAIEPGNCANAYTGRLDSIDIKDRMLFKSARNNAFEVHLQAYIMQNFDKAPLNRLLLPLCDTPAWVGNEVSCGVGMQRIDVMVIQEAENDVYIKVVELKCVDPYLDILEQQLPWYIQWVSDYIAPNYTTLGKNVHIIPCVLAKNAACPGFINECQVFHQRYTNQNGIVVEPAEYIGFQIQGNNISFTRLV